MARTRLFRLQIGERQKMTKKEFFKKWIVDTSTDVLRERREEFWKELKEIEEKEDA